MIGATISEKLRLCYKNLSKHDEYVRVVIESLAQNNAPATHDDLTAEYRAYESLVTGELSFPEKGIFEISLGAVQNRIGDDAAHEIMVAVVNKLNMELKIDIVALNLLGPDGGELRFVKKNVALQRGSNKLMLACQVFVSTHSVRKLTLQLKSASISGTYTADRVTLNTGKITFKCELLKEDGPKIKFRVCENMGSVSVKLSPAFRGTPLSSWKVELT